MSKQIRGRDGKYGVPLVLILTTAAIAVSAFAHVLCPLSPSVASDVEWHSNELQLLLLQLTEHEIQPACSGSQQFVHCKMNKLLRTP